MSFSNFNVLIYYNQIEKFYIITIIYLN